MIPAPFSLDVEDNQEGWGPSTVPERLKDMPFAPFSKGDKLGKAADWTANAYNAKFAGARAAKAGRGSGQGAGRRAAQQGWTLHPGALQGALPGGQGGPGRAPTPSPPP
jgi:hypothetical protein